MSTPPQNGEAARGTCPRCLRSFSPTPSASEDGPPACPGHGTVTVHPEPPPLPSTPATPVSVSDRVGRFEVRRFVGEGAFGLVYEAYDPSLKRAVALKVARDEQ